MRSTGQSLLKDTFLSTLSNFAILSETVLENETLCSICTTRKEVYSHIGEFEFVRDVYKTK